MNENLTLIEVFSLIDSIKKSTGLTERDISERIGYHPGHISQMRTKEILSPKFVKTLLREFDVNNVREYISDNDPSAQEPNVDIPTNSLVDIISRLTRTVENQQMTIHSLCKGE